MVCVKYKATCLFTSSNLRIVAVVGFTMNKGDGPAYIHVYLPTTATLKGVTAEIGLRRSVTWTITKGCAELVGRRASHSCGLKLNLTVCRSAGLNPAPHSWYRAAPCTEPTDPVSWRTEWLTTTTTTPHKPRLVRSFLGLDEKQTSSLWFLPNALCALCVSARSWASCLCQLSGLQSRQYSM